MFAKIRFDRKIDLNRHYISPGGYEMTAGGKTYQFDYMDYSGRVLSDRRDVLECEMHNLDTVSFPDAAGFDPKQLERIDEFFVYTGETDEEEIHPVELLELSFYAEEEVVTVPASILKAAVLTDGAK